jgi:beta-lactam-binding protein with PASTA domain
MPQLTSGLTIGSAGGAGGGTIGVPDLRGSKRAEAVKAVQSLGLIARVRTVVAVGTEGEVYDQQPRPPALRAAGSVVTIDVIENPAPPQPDIATRLDDVASKVDRVAGKIDSVTQNIGNVHSKVKGLGTVLQRVDRAVASPPAPSE